MTDDQRKLVLRVENLERALLAYHALSEQFLPQPMVQSLSNMMPAFFESCIANGSDISDRGATFKSIGPGCTTHEWGYWG